MNFMHRDEEVRPLLTLAPPPLVAALLVEHLPVVLAA